MFCHRRQLPSPLFSPPFPPHTNLCLPALPTTHLGFLSSPPLDPHTPSPHTLTPSTRTTTNQILQEMGELRRNVEADLSACQASLDEEAQADAAARAKYGDDWRVPQSATLAKHLWEKLHSYRWGGGGDVSRKPGRPRFAFCGGGGGGRLGHR